MKCTVHQTLSESSAGRSVLAELGAPEPNGPILDLITEPIDALLARKTIELTGLSPEAFCKAFGVTRSTRNAWRYQGVRRQGAAAYFRLVALEGLPVPSKKANVSTEVLDDIIEICDGIDGFMAETGLSRFTAERWIREGVPTHYSRWTQVFMMTLPESILKE